MAIASFFVETQVAFAMLGLMVVMPLAVSVLAQRTFGDGSAMFSGILTLVVGTWAAYEVSPSLIKDDGNAILLVLLAIVLFGATIWALMEEAVPFYRKR
jgi:hypothetical protein